MATKMAAPEQMDLRRAYVRDGIMRAYANRFGLLAILCAVVAVVSLGFAIYVRIQPATIIRVAPDGESTVIGGRPLFHRKALATPAGTSSSPEPMPYEKERIIEDFLDDYLNYDYRNIGERWSSALNLMAEPLKTSALNVIKKEDRVGRVREDQVRSTFQVRQLEISKQDPLAYTVYGVRSVYRMDGARETAEQMVNRYEIRLAMPDRSAQNPRGLLIGDYRETQLQGETKEPSLIADTGGITPSVSGNRNPNGNSEGYAKNAGV
jgi:hypothetical protein